MTHRTSSFPDSRDDLQSSQGKNGQRPASGNPTLRALAIGGTLLILFIARHLGGLAPAPPVSVPEVETFSVESPIERPVVPQPTFLQAQDSKLEPSDPSIPTERTTMLPVPDFSR